MGWHPIGLSCYLARTFDETEDRTWTAARDKCSELGDRNASLVSINTPEEYQTVSLLRRVKFVLSVSGDNLESFVRSWTVFKRQTI